MAPLGPLTITKYTAFCISVYYSALFLHLTIPWFEFLSFMIQHPLGFPFFLNFSTRIMPPHTGSFPNFFHRWLRTGVIGGCAWKGVARQYPNTRVCLQAYQKTVSDLTSGGRPPKLAFIETHVKPN